MKLNDYEMEHVQILREHLSECTVLLKSNGDFPIETAGEIALYGNGARNTIKGGTGSGEVNSRYSVSVEQGLKDAGFKVTTAEWMDGYDKVHADAHKLFVKEIKDRAKANKRMAIMESMGAIMAEPEYELPLNGSGDVAVYVLARISGEGSDRQFKKGEILLTESEIRDILYLNEHYAKFMLVLNVGGPVDLTPVLDVNNILVLSQLGVETGCAVADLLLGKSYPSGKLTTTWAKSSDYPKVGEFGDINETHYTEGIYVGYRYFDSADVKPLFPFGFGLGYTQFSISDEKFDVDGEKITVTATVTNTGKFPGKEVLQLYVSVPEGKLDQPVKSLSAFAKTNELKAGDSEKLSVEFKMSDIASYDEETASYILESGEYVLNLGTSVRDTKAVGAVKLNETVCVRKTENQLGDCGFKDWKPEKSNNAEIIKNDGYEVKEISANAISTTVVAETIKYEIEPEVEKLTDEQLAYMAIGAFEEKGGMLSVIGSASIGVAGAAGETCGKVKDVIPVIIMADGPAGVRIAKDYVETENGPRALGSSLPESFSEFFPLPVRLLMKLTAKKPKKGEEIKHQYCTAIPIGTAIAQSFNVDFAKMCGDMVGDEMERFGVHLWLAPALNIHRSIQCGRNFEYFSEDPLVSGLFAAAITNGVQAHPGCGTTIKHFAANNQETNRYFSNSLVSERAMREIYLRGFEICINESHPHSLMTSYNLLNGTHTSEHKGLVEGILRKEYGYEGLVMTDWVVASMTAEKGSIYSIAKASKVVAATGDVFMPGCKGDLDDVLEALKNGDITREELLRGASAIYRNAKKLQR